MHPQLYTHCSEVPLPYQALTAYTNDIVAVLKHVLQALDHGEENPGCALWYRLPQDKGCLCMYADIEKEKGASSVVCMAPCDEHNMWSDLP